jgi:hypothetical protein
VLQGRFWVLMVMAMATMENNVENNGGSR